ncbi:DUF4124 domain-containing protein [Ramlibacter sp. H39-3-26]|uniref:DUF4124 domain-containing protein n=1 Tax=Curvibacter soli TaxID=3031331 RepID=UPI0023DA190D|nr:DUF4124 domain-containing protein [Ramlibacter sp. H39-3-26]MDF1485386.1 DUF4124 domain-containing protein [Ramlibacter sp. H39-3-26]
MKLRHFLLFALACACSFGAAAQWQWVDKDGRKVFSDRPPPPDIPEKSILKYPPGSHAGAPAKAEAAAESAMAAAPAATKPAAKDGVDKELEEMKKQAEAAEVAKKKAEEEKVAKARAENCARARESKASLDSGMRIARVNAQGERIIMDDTARASESARAQSIIASDCGAR